MKVKFPNYSVSMLCNCTAKDITNKILKTVECKSNNLKVLRVTYCKGIQKIDLSACNEGYLYYNSFMPIVNIEVEEGNDKTQISMFFKLHKSTKMLMKLFFLLILIFAIALLTLCILNQLSTNKLLFFPLGMFIFSYTLSAVELYISSKEVLRILVLAITDDDISKLECGEKRRHGLR